MTAEDKALLIDLFFPLYKMWNDVENEIKENLGKNQLNNYNQ